MKQVCYIAVESMPYKGLAPWSPAYECSFVNVSLANPRKQSRASTRMRTKAVQQITTDSVIFTSSTQATYAITGCFYLSKYNATAITIDLINVAIVGIYEKS